MSIGHKLDSNRGLAPAFDLLRLVLALAVVTYHSFWVARTGTDFGVTRLTWFPTYAALPIFFTLTGFLVCGSAERLALPDFLLNRALRIVPALLVEILLSAFVVGAIFTTLPLGAYFTSPQTWRYLTNIVGLVNFNLPGVFENLPSAKTVNISLWTIPVEIACYGGMAVLMASGLIRSRFAAPALIALWSLTALLAQGLQLHWGHDLLARIVDKLYFGPAPRLVLSAVWGVAVYQLRHRIPRSWALFAAAVAVCVATAAFLPLSWRDAPVMAVLSCGPLAYITAFIGTLELPKLTFLRTHDYSYGIYLYGFTIQQAVKSTFPQITEPLVLTALALPVITVFAALSWELVELPVMRLRKTFSFIAQTRLGVLAAPPPGIALPAKP
jgi:peptidoglycan/LPS O-acetylase OafA/YrhL